MNENKNPLVSIIIPVYNDSEFLHESLDSAVNQTLKNIEIICVNDASTDNSLEIMNEYAAKDKRVRVINRSENGSALMARKDGIMAARGDFTMFLDGDDDLVPTACETAYNLILKNDVDILWFSSTWQEIADDRSVLSSSIKNPALNEIICGREAIQNLYFLENKSASSLWDKIFTTELLKLSHSKIKVFYCLFLNDFYADYYISYYAKRMMGISTGSLVKYYRGRGGWGQHKISLETFEKDCSVIQSINLIRQFLESEGTLEEQERYLLAWKNTIKNSCFSIFCHRVKSEDLGQAVKILYRSWNEKNDTQEIILHFLTGLRNYINWAGNLEKTNKNLLTKIQIDNENKTARINELQDWSKEQLKAKEWFLSQNKYKDERIAELEKVSGFCYKILSKIFRILRRKN